MHKPLLTTVFIVFTLLTGYTLWYYGGLVPYLLFYTRDPASWQIFMDIVIVMCMLLYFIRRDAAATGRPFWPWALLSLCTGSFGPLLYFLTAKRGT